MSSVREFVPIPLYKGIPKRDLRKICLSLISKNSNQQITRPKNTISKITTSKNHINRYTSAPLYLEQIWSNNANHEKKKEFWLNYPDIGTKSQPVIKSSKHIPPISVGIKFQLDKMMNIAVKNHKIVGKISPVLKEYNHRINSGSSQSEKLIKSGEFKILNSLSLNERETRNKKPFIGDIKCEEQRTQEPFSQSYCQKFFNKSPRYLKNNVERYFEEPKQEIHNFQKSHQNWSHLYKDNEINKNSILKENLQNKDSIKPKRNLSNNVFGAAGAKTGKNDLELNKVLLEEKAEQAATTYLKNKLSNNVFSAAGKKTGKNDLELNKVLLEEKAEQAATPYLKNKLSNNVFSAAGKKTGKNDLELNKVLLEEKAEQAAIPYFKNKLKKVTLKEEISHARYDVPLLLKQVKTIVNGINEVSSRTSSGPLRPLASEKVLLQEPKLDKIIKKHKPVNSIPITAKLQKCVSSNYLTLNYDQRSKLKKILSERLAFRADPNYEAMMEKEGVFMNKSLKSAIHFRKTLQQGKDTDKVKQFWSSGRRKLKFSSKRKNFSVANKTKKKKNEVYKKEKRKHGFCANKGGKSVQKLDHKKIEKWSDTPKLYNLMQNYRQTVFGIDKLGQKNNSEYSKHYTNLMRVKSPSQASTNLQRLSNINSYQINDARFESKHSVKRNAKSIRKESFNDQVVHEANNTKSLFENDKSSMKLKITPFTLNNQNLTNTTKNKTAVHPFHYKKDKKTIGYRVSEHTVKDKNVSVHKTHNPNWNRSEILKPNLKPVNLQQYLERKSSRDTTLDKHSDNRDGLIIFGKSIHKNYYTNNKNDFSINSNFSKIELLKSVIKKNKLSENKLGNKFIKYQISDIDERNVKKYREYNNSLIEEPTNTVSKPSAHFQNSVSQKSNPLLKTEIMDHEVNLTRRSERQHNKEQLYILPHSYGDSLKADQKVELEKNYQRSSYLGEFPVSTYKTVKTPLRNKFMGNFFNRNFSNSLNPNNTEIYQTVSKDDAIKKNLVFTGAQERILSLNHHLNQQSNTNDSLFKDFHSSKNNYKENNKVKTKTLQLHKFFPDKQFLQKRIIIHTKTGEEVHLSNTFVKKNSLSRDWENEKQIHSSTRDNNRETQMIDVKPTLTGVKESGGQTNTFKRQANSYINKFNESATMEKKVEVNQNKLNGIYTSKTKPINIGTQTQLMSRNTRKSFQTNSKNSVHYRKRNSNRNFDASYKESKFKIDNSYKGSENRITLITTMFPSTATILDSLLKNKKQLTEGKTNKNKNESFHRMNHRGKRELGKPNTIKSSKHVNRPLKLLYYLGEPVRNTRISKSKLTLPSDVSLSNRLTIKTSEQKDSNMKNRSKKNKVIQNLLL